MGLRLQPPGTSSSTSTSSSFPDPYDTPSLATLDRNEGRTLREYHDKRRIRMRGRRKDQTLTDSSGNGSTLKSSDNGSTLKSSDNGSTLKSSDNGSTLKSSDNGSTLKSSDNGSTLKSSGGVHPSALYTSYQKTGSKTVKKKLVIEQQDVSLSRRLVSSFASSLTSVQSRRLGDPQTQTRNVCIPPLDPQVMVGASAAGQMAALKSILVSMLGEEMWNEACFLIMTVTSHTDLQVLENQDSCGQRGASVTLRCIESRMLGLRQQKWFANFTDVKRHPIADEALTTLLPRTQCSSHTAPTGTIYSHTAPTGTLYSHTAPTGTLYSHTAPTGTLYSHTAPTGTLYSLAAPTGTLYINTLTTDLLMEETPSVTETPYSSAITTHSYSCHSP
ncbi:hypothetical protein ACOMHN_055308 [Nucella lapillus]